MKRTLTVLACALGLGAALAATRVPGTSTYYSAQRDPITDANTGSITINEANDTYGVTQFTVRCADRNGPGLWAFLTSKNDLLSRQQAEMGQKPALTLRLGNDPPVMLGSSDMVSVVNSRDDLMTRHIGLKGPVVRRVVADLNAGKRLVIRVDRASGGQALTYTFPAQGFDAAWRGVNGCASYASAPRGGQSATPRGVATGAPRFTQWYFSGCRDVASRANRTGLLAGRAHLCDLVIETIPNGARPVSAEFRYELEYRQGLVSGKFTLPGVDRWPSSGSTVTRFRQEGNRLVFTLPLKVRARAERLYTSLNVTGKVTFSNGAVKSVYEPLLVQPVN